MQKVILFGGSFDPIHYGHLKVASIAKDYIKADEVVFILAQNPRWKTPATSKEDRLQMLELAIKGYDNFSIDLTEYNSNAEVNYTFDTISAIKKDSKEYYFLIGSDQVDKLHLWHRIEELKEMVHFICFKRPGWEINQENILKYNIQIIDKKEYDISSTALRFMHSLDAPKIVLDYIIEHELYYVKTMKHYISNKRFTHTVSVANLSYDIALRNNVDPFKAYLASLLHDISKELPKEEQHQFMVDNYLEFVDVISPELYHQFISYDIAKTIFKIEDEDILNAIKYHATGNANMSPLAMIIYSSDKIEPTRNYDSSTMIEGCLKDYYQGFIQVLKENISFFESKGIKYHNPLTDACLKQYIK